jgi:hypothetical protein
LRVLKWTAISLVAILAIAFGVGCYFMGSPRDLYGFLRYALPQWHRGDLKVGDAAPDARLIGLDGQSSFYVQERIGTRPLVLIFGSYT